MIDLMYGRGMLLSLNRDQGPSTLVKENLRRLGISVTGRRRRGCRAGRRCRATNLLAVGNGAFVVTSNRQPKERSAKKCRQSPSLTPLTAGGIADGAASTDMSDAAGAGVDIVVQTSPARVLRHTSPITQQLVFGCMKVRSATGKIDDIIAMKRDQSIDVLCLCETWHDEDSVSIRRLRAESLRGSARTRPSQVSQRVVDFVHKPWRCSDCHVSKRMADRHQQPQPEAFIPARLRSRDVLQLVVQCAADLSSGFAGH